MSAFLGLSAAAAGIDALTGIGNFYEQEKNREYMQGVQKETWRREDNAVQRKVEDLKKAGLSPVLAAGSAAQAGPVVSTAAPQMHINAQDKVAGMLGIAQAELSMMRQKVDIAKTEADTDLTRLQQKRVVEETQGQHISNLFNEQTLDTRVAQVKQDLQAGRVGIVGKELDNRLKELGITTEQLKQVQIGIETTLKGKQITSTELDILTKQLAIEIQEYNYDWFKDIKMPTNTNPNDWQKAYGAFKNALQDIKKGPQGVDGSGRLGQYNPVNPNFLRVP